MIRCIIIEDEHLAAEKLKSFIDKIGNLSLQAVFDNGTDALSFLITNETDLLFLDICMAELDGMQLLKALTNPPRIIITSAESSYAVQGYEYNVTDYLLKPFGFDRFLKAVDKVRVELTIAQQRANDYIFVKTEYRSQRIDLGNIYYIQGMKDYLSIVLSKERVMTLMSFNEMLKLLPASQFMRVHKSFIISLDKIRTIEKRHVVINEKSIPVSNSYSDDFFKLLRLRKRII